MKNTTADRSGIISRYEPAVTTVARNELNLHVGQAVWALVKAVSLRGSVDLPR